LTVNILTQLSYFGFVHTRIPAETMRE